MEAKAQCKVLCESYVIKAPPVGQTGHWRIRYLVLTMIVVEDVTIPRLCYYEDHRAYLSQIIKKEVILCNSNTRAVAKISRVMDHPKYHRLCAVEALERTYYFAVKTEEIMRKWLDAFKACLPGGGSCGVAYVRDVNLSKKDVPLSSLQDDPTDEDVAAAAGGGPKERRWSLKLGNSKNRRSSHSQPGQSSDPVAVTTSKSLMSSGGSLGLPGVHSCRSMTNSSHRGLPTPPNPRLDRRDSSKSLVTTPSQSFAPPFPPLPLETIGDPDHRETAVIKAKLATAVRTLSLSAIDSGRVAGALGKGNFGTVTAVENALRLPVDRKGEQIPGTIAIKRLKSSCSVVEQNQFLSEALILSRMDHPHIVRLMAVQIDKNPSLMVMEVMNEGNLRDYLRECKEEGIIVPYIIKLWVMLQIACAMNYISVIKKMMHRDVAARNILLHRLANGDVLAKISDFGLSKFSTEYTVRVQRSLPVKWLSLEVLRDGIYTAKSDVWAFGIALWEALSDGMTPYSGVSNRDVYFRLETGMRLDRPAQCSDYIYALILSCTEKMAQNRPDFYNISRLLADHVKQIACDECVDERVDECMRDVVQESMKKRDEEEEEEDDYTPMLPITLTGDILSQVSQDWVDSLGVAGLQKLLLQYGDKSQHEQPEFQNDIVWLRNRVWSMCQTRAKRTSSTSSDASAASVHS